MNKNIKIFSSVIEDESRDSANEFGYVTYYDNIKAYFEVYKRDDEVELTFLDDKIDDNFINECNKYFSMLFKGYDVLIYYDDKRKINNKLDISFDMDYRFRIILNGYYIGYGTEENKNIEWWDEEGDIHCDIFSCMIDNVDEIEKLIKDYFRENLEFEIKNLYINLID